MTNSTKDMIDMVDVSDLKLTVGYPSGTLAKITRVGNLRLNNDVILFNVLVVPEYTSEIKAKSSPSPYDDKGGPSRREGGVYFRHVLTPLPENIVLAHKESKNDKFLVNLTNYQRLVGKLINLTLTKPAISYAVHCCPGSGIQFSKRNSGFNVVALCDFDSANCLVTRRSICGYCVFVNGCLVSWKSKKETMAAATCEVMWIVKIMRDLNANNMIRADLYCDNKSTIQIRLTLETEHEPISAIQISTNLFMHEKTKHFDIDVHLVKEKVASGLIKTVKVDSKD
ncbi:ribonuclease H-like domain-containing protein [Tanacetum coccineum]